MYDTLIGTTNPRQSRPGSNDNKRSYPHCPDLQNRSFTFICNLVSYPKSHLSAQDTVPLTLESDYLVFLCMFLPTPQ